MQLLDLPQAIVALGAADRALLSLSVDRGLDDERLAALSGVPVRRLQARRAQIDARLASVLGIPPASVRAALDELAAHTAHTTHTTQTTPTTQAVPATVPPAPVHASARRPVLGRRRRAGALAAIAAAAIAVALLAAHRAEGDQARPGVTPSAVSRVVVVHAGAAAAYARTHRAAAPPGCTVTARTPVPRSSWRSESVKPGIANFDAQ